MSRQVSLSALMALNDQYSDDPEIVLLYITHPDLPTPIRLSSFPTESVSDDPLMYGVRSAWKGSNPATEPFLSLPIDTILPGDLEEAAATGNFVFELVDNDILTTLRSLKGYANLDIAVVLGSSPDTPEFEAFDNKIGSYDANSSSVTIYFGQENIENERHPCDRMTKQQFPGLHR